MACSFRRDFWKQPRHDGTFMYLVLYTLEYLEVVVTRNMNT